MRSKDTGLMEQIKKFVQDYAMYHNGELPSTREVGEELSISKSTAVRYIREMAERQMLQYDRGLTGTTRGKPMETASRMFDILGSIPCGTAEEREALVEGSIALPDMLLNGQKGSFYLLRADGYSMKDAGIGDGDLVLIHQQEEAREGDIVAALVDGWKSTLKRLKRDEKGMYLWAENREWPEEERIMRFERLEIQGVAITAIKNLCK